MTVRIQEADFDVSTEIDALCAGRADIGAVATFVGLVRDVNAGADGQSTQVGGMTLEHYPGMTERAIEAIVAEAKARWNLFDATVIHRIGTLRPRDRIVLVAVSGGHRGEAFAGCEFIMDFLKTRAPFWKKERTPDGERWVDARASDDAAAARWADEKAVK